MSDQKIDKLSDKIDVLESKADKAEVRQGYITDNIETISESIIEINKALNSISVTLIRNTDSLDYHIKRTDLLETDMKAVKDHVNKVNLIAKYVLAAVAPVAGFIAWVVSIFK